MKMEKELTVKRFGSLIDLCEYIKSELKDPEDSSCTLQMEEGVFECNTIEDAFELMVAKMMIELENEEEWLVLHLSMIWNINYVVI